MPTSVKRAFRPHSPLATATLLAFLLVGIALIYLVPRALGHCSLRVEAGAWVDANGDGAWDDDEAPLPDVRFIVATDRSSEERYYSGVTTDSEGKTRFEFLLPGRCPSTVFVSALPPDGYETITTDSVVVDPAINPAQIQFGFAVSAGMSVNSTTSLTTADDAAPGATAANDATTTSIQSTTHPAATDSLPAVSTVEEITAPRKIDTGRILRFWWAADSLSLIYVTPGMTWHHDLASGETSLLAPESWEQGAPDVTLPGIRPDAILKRFPSPSGERTLVWTAVAPTRTPSPELGEQYLGGQTTALWLWSNGQGERLGQLPLCFIGADWSANEEIAVLLTDPHANCTGHGALAVSWSEQRLHWLFPRDSYPGLITIYDVSRDGTQLLFSELGADTGLSDQTAIKLNIATQHIQPFPFLHQLQSAHWLADDNFVLKFRRKNLQIVALYSPDNQATIDILSTETIGERTIFAEQVSPDGRLLALTAGSSINTNTELWLVPLEQR